VAFDLRFGEGANHPVKELAPFKEKDGRDALDGVLGCGHWILVYVELCHLNPAYILRSEVIEDRGHHVAGTAPRGPAVDRNRVWAGQDRAGECLIRYGHRVIKDLPAHERGPALGAYRVVLEPVPGHPISGAALGARQYDAVLIQMLPPLLNPDCAVDIYCGLKILAATLVSRFCFSTYL
jgi:hypothetical protein